MTGRPSEPLLELRDVDVRFGGRRSDGDVHALRGMSLTIRPGERVAIVGRSGVGKSTVAGWPSAWSRQPQAGSASAVPTWPAGRAPSCGRSAAACT